MSVEPQTVVQGGDPKHNPHNFQPAGQNIFDAPLGVCRCGARLYARVQVAAWTLDEWLDRLEAKGCGYVTFARYLYPGSTVMGYRLYLTNDASDLDKRYPLYGQGVTRAQAAESLLRAVEMAS